jgi:hypothetical protein
MEEKAPLINDAATSTEKVKAVKPQKKVTRSLHDILGGDYLSKERVIRNVPFIFYIAFLALVYIANTYYAEKTYKQIERTKTELKELRFLYLTSRSTLMFNGRQTLIANRAAKFGLKETVLPPYKIFYNKTTTSVREEK